MGPPNLPKKNLWRFGGAQKSHCNFAFFHCTLYSVEFGESSFLLLPCRVASCDIDTESVQNILPFPFFFLVLFFCLAQ